MVTKAKTQCMYKDKCVDEGQSKCTACVHNERRSDYQPYDTYTWYPSQTWDPWTWPTPTPSITYDPSYYDGGGTSLETQSYYQAIGQF